MTRAKSTLWREEGYNLFAQEGLDGIQVERLARILQLNKSGFYHYFHDLEGFCRELIALHVNKVDLFLQDVRKIKTIDPDYLLLLVKHPQVVMFQVQLIRNKDRNSLYAASQVVDQKVNFEVTRLWSDYLGVQASSDLAIRYYYIVRDMLYTRISFQNLNYHFLHNLFTEARALVDQIALNRSPLQIDKKQSRCRVDDAV